MLEHILLFALAAAPVARHPTAEVKEDQVAAAVEDSFPAHDLNGNGRLSRAEFTAWLAALKAKSDRTFRPDAPASKAWLADMFNKADKDGNAAVTPAEFVQFLRQAKP